jgi:hypothetical protein
MTCGRFDDREAGKLTAEEFADHAQTCAECAGLVALDAHLDEALAGWREAAPPPELWARIEAALSEPGAAAGKEPKRPPAIFRTLSDVFRPRPVLAASGAVALLLLLSGAGLLLRNALTPSGILTRRALAGVEIKEREYSDAIVGLERLAEPKIEAMDPQLGSLYREKLVVIDAQIEKCRDALSSNPGNAHIRRYLLAALRDKREALAGALESR